MFQQTLLYYSLRVSTWCKQRLGGIYKAQQTSPMFFSRWLFLRCLGCIYFIAFMSLWLQVDGLIGSQGILPAAEYLELLYKKFGAKSYFIAPSLFWLSAADGTLHLFCAAGVFLSLLLSIGVMAPLALAGLWLLYLSFLSVGQDFLSFQWDILLLETGLLAIFFAPWQLYPKFSRESRVPRSFLWLLRWLLFRLMFASGYVKLASDSSWRDLSALYYHYETQPLPTWIAWYAHQLAPWFQKFSATAMLGIELALPFLIFGPRRLRNIACLGLIALQLLIILTGNYGFFNLLTITLCILLVDDLDWKKLFSFLKFRKIDSFVSSSPPTSIERLSYKAYILRGLAIFFFVLSAFQFSTQFLGWARSSTAIRGILSTFRPLHIVGSYGLFAHMTKTRPEITVEGSNDGLLWREYQFKWKVENPRKRPRWAAPHQPRLDWQMWFAALRGNCRNAPWFISFMLKLLKNEAGVVGLLAKNPFPKAPPRHLRAVLYNYQFTDFNTRQSQGRWWKRKRLGLYCPVLSLRK